MRANGKPRYAAGRAALGGVTVSLVLGLAACGSVVAGQSGQSGNAASGSSGTAASGSQPALCTSMSSLTRVVVSRTVGLTHVREVVPGGVTISDPTTVRNVASTLCSLPNMPRGPISCPAMLGGSYKFMFTATKRAFPPVTVQSTGCRTVTGLAHPDRRVVSPHAWKDLTGAFNQRVPMTPGHANATH